MWVWSPRPRGQQLHSEADDDAVADISPLDEADVTDEADVADDADPEQVFEELEPITDFPEVDAEDLERQWQEAVVLEDARYKELAEIGQAPLYNDPVCRGIVVCITTGNETDTIRAEELETRLKDEFGDRISFCHNWVKKADPTIEDPGFPLFEVWLESYNHVVMHSRYAGDEGDLDEAKIDEIIQIVDYQTNDDQKDIGGIWDFADQDDEAF